MRVFNLEEELKKLPAKPGVYLMHNKMDEIIYVGKAIILKNRVRQYFQSSRGKTAKIQEMVSNIAWFEYIITDSEMEALVLECNLIKEHQPKYNTMLKDDKGYPYIRITVEEDFPKVIMAREMKRDQSRYFGPYTSAGAVKETLELLHKLYQIRTCFRVLPRDTGKERPCLNYHIKQCPAPCQGLISSVEYKKNIDGVIRFLNGDYEDVLTSLEEKMKKASDELDFEEAIRYRELLQAVKHVAQKQKITDSASQEDRDVIAMAMEGNDGVVEVFFIRGGKMIGRDFFHLDTSSIENKSQALSSFVKQFYAGTPFLPKELLLQEELEDAQVISDWLSEKKGKKVTLRTPKKGEKERLVDLAARNAKMVLEQDKEKIKREELRTVGAVKQLSELLNLQYLKRIEAFDISNTSGFQSVGSMVVYENGKPKRNDFRKFRIKSVQGPDDYASMEEVLGRRFLHGMKEQQGEDLGKFSHFPDVILMDGGRGQVNVAERVLNDLGLSIPVCGMVKDDHHRTRGLFYHNMELPIDRHSECFQMITRIQDEAHRFAIEYHRSLRQGNNVHSILDDIKGVGETRRKKLMQHYDNLEQLKVATVEELSQLDGFNHRAAQSVYDFFHGK